MRPAPLLLALVSLAAACGSSPSDAAPALEEPASAATSVASAPVTAGPVTTAPPTTVSPTTVPPSAVPVTEPAPSVAVATAPATTGVPATTVPGSSAVAAAQVPSGPAAPRPDWLGTRPLPLRADGFGQVQPTPAELVDRRLETVDVLAAPAGDAFSATVTPVPADVAARSTWTEGCPVPLHDLRYITMTFWGFDERAHTGEMIVHAEAAQDIVAVFAQMYAARFPIEEMRVVAPAELEAPPYGDGNNTTAFVCRAVTAGTSWSQHAYGLAIDVNPFHNPYQRGDLVLPELAGAYTDRTALRPGMIVSGDAVTAAFAGIGWGWGGHWRSLTDPQHFSRNGS